VFLGATQHPVRCFDFPELENSERELYHDAVAPIGAAQELVQPAVAVLGSPALAAPPQAEPAPQTVEAPLLDARFFTVSTKVLKPNRPRQPTVYARPPHGKASVPCTLSSISKHPHALLVPMIIMMCLLFVLCRFIIVVATFT
jgi:hypothetical protein